MVFLGKIVLKICSKFKGEHPWRSECSPKMKKRFPVDHEHFSVDHGVLNVVTK